MPHINPEVAQCIAEALIGLHTQWKPSVKQTWLSGQLERPLRKFSYMCIPKWAQRDQFLSPTITQIIDELRQQPESNTDLGSINLCRPTSCVFQCPRCGTPKQVAHIKMAKEHTWNTLTCARALCHNKAASSRWLCPCGLRWQACKTHSLEGFKCGSPSLGILSFRLKKVASRPPGLARCLTRLKTSQVFAET